MFFVINEDNIFNFRYSGIYQLTQPCLMIYDPELIKQIAVKDFDHFTDHRNFVPENVDPLFAKNLFTLKGNRHISNILIPNQV